MSGRSLVLLLFISTNMFGQSKMSFSEIDSASYALYINGKWKELVSLGKIAKQNKIDFYYLQMRLGIANTELNKYRAATPHFEKARGYFSNEYVNEYSYYNYLLTDRYDEAVRVSKRFTDEQIDRLYTKKIASINGLLVDFGIKIPSGTSNGVVGFFDLGINHRITRGYSVNHQISFFSQKRTGYTLNQIQYALSGNIPLKKGFQINPTFHYVYYTAGTAAPGEMATEKSSFAGSVSVLKHFPIADVALINSVANLDSNMQIQHGANITLFPLYNQKLSLSASGYINTQNNYQNLSFYVTGQIHYQFISFASATVQYYHGSMFNALENNGLFVNNNPDLLKDRASFILNFTIKKRFHVFGLYQFESRTSASDNSNYYFNTISLGTKLLF